MPNNLNITVICGHYGSGKTNLCLNLAAESAASGKNTVVMDMDIVNPYFRSSEYGSFFEEKGIKLIAPNCANSTLDTPSLSAEIYSIFAMENTNVFIDVGGDDAGATALGRIQQEISDNGYSMIYVINCYRILSRESKEAVELLHEIERASRLKATALVNNSHLGVDTTLETVKTSIDFAKSVSEFTGLPLEYSTVPDFALNSGDDLGDFKKIQRLVLFPWEQAENN